MSPDLALALSLADAADAISLGRFRASDLLVETKPDRTPVTEADRAVEEAIRERLAVERPDDGMLGEEFGVTRRRQPPLDRRPDRRHPELLARDPGLGDADRARGGRRDPARRRLGACPRAALVGRAGRGSVRRTAIRSTSPGSPRSRMPSSASRSSSRCRRSRSAAGTRAPTATSGRTCSSPRAPSTARSTRSASRSGISPRCSRSSRRPAGASATADGTARVDGLSAISSNGLLHEALLERPRVERL